MVAQTYNEYKVGSTPWIAINFDDHTQTPAVAADPTTVTFTVRWPDRTETVYTYPASPELTKLSTGRYRFEFPTLVQKGKVEYGSNGTGAIVAAESGYFYAVELLP